MCSCEHCNSVDHTEGNSACSEDIRCRRRSVGTRSEEILPSPERCNQKSVFLGAPLSRCYHQGGMQRRLSARASGVVESSRSGGGSDCELNHVTRANTNMGVFAGNSKLLT